MKSSSVSKPDVYERVTNLVIDKLAQGVVPWKSPYLAQGGFPKNFFTGKRYRGMNVFLLAMRGYESPWFLTYRQAQDMGGQVRKGERGALVVKAGQFEPKDENGEKESERWYLKGYTVFNACQIDGIEFPKPENIRTRERVKSNALAEETVRAMPHPPKILIGRKVIGCYNRHLDEVDVPVRERMVSDGEYYSTLFHELVHSTGHELRLARESLLKSKAFGARETERLYSLEELVAEMGASFLCAHVGIENETLDSSAAYLDSWLRVLKAKDNKRWIIKAASAAQKAADYILGKEVPA